MASFRNGDVEIAYFDEGAGRADRAGARLCLDQGGQLGRARLGDDADARRAARHRARQSRPWRVEQALRSGRLSQRQDGGRRARAARSSANRARRRDGLFDGRAHHGVSGDRIIRRACARPFSAGLASSWSKASACRRPSPMRWKRRRSTTSPIRPVADVPRLRRADQIRPAALAACIRGSRQTLSREQVAAIGVPVLVAVGTKDDVAGIGARTGRADPGRPRARHPGSRPHAGGRR